MRDQSHGGYAETTSEKEVMDYTTYVPCGDSTPPSYIAYVLDLVLARQ